MFIVGRLALAESIGLVKWIALLLVIAAKVLTPTRATANIILKLVDPPKITRAKLSLK